MTTSSKLEFCKQVLDRFNGKWPVPGGLALAADAYDDKKTVDQAEGIIRAKMASMMKKR